MLYCRFFLMWLILWHGGLKHTWSLTRWLDLVSTLHASLLCCLKSGIICACISMTFYEANMCARALTYMEWTKSFATHLKVEVFWLINEMCTCMHASSYTDVSFVGTFEAQMCVMSDTGVYHCKLHHVIVVCFCTRHHLGLHYLSFMF